MNPEVARIKNRFYRYHSMDTGDARRALQEEIVSALLKDAAPAAPDS